MWLLDTARYMQYSMHTASQQRFVLYQKDIDFLIINSFHVNVSHFSYTKSLKPTACVRVCMYMHKCVG